jgi:hypothetical protein
MKHLALLISVLASSLRSKRLCSFFAWHAIRAHCHCILTKSKRETLLPSPESVPNPFCSYVDSLLPLAYVAVGEEEPSSTSHRDAQSLLHSGWWSGQRNLLAKQIDTKDLWALTP